MENMPIATASVSWLDPSGQAHIRVYSTDGYTVTERCLDGQSWLDGKFSEAGSAVSATCWNDAGGTHIRVYCTFQDVTTEWCLDDGTGWTKGSYTVVD
jgi:hypothetical protein